MKRLACALRGHVMTRTLISWGWFDPEANSRTITWHYNCLRCSHQFQQDSVMDHSRKVIR